MTSSCEDVPPAVVRTDPALLVSVWLPPDNKVHGASMGPSGAERNQVGPMNFAIWLGMCRPLDPLFHQRDPLVICTEMSYIVLCGINFSYLENSSGDICENFVEIPSLRYFLLNLPLRLG